MRGGAGVVALGLNGITVARCAGCGGRKGQSGEIEVELVEALHHAIGILNDGEVALVAVDRGSGRA